MKHFIFSLLLSTAAFATTTDHVKAPGRVFLNTFGFISKHGVSLHLPKDAKGKAILQVGKKQVESLGYVATKRHGQTALHMAFLNPPGTPKGSVAILSGTYMRGRNVVIYYGDVLYKKFGAKAKAPSFSDLMESSCSLTGSCATQCECSDGCPCRKCECDGTDNCSPDCDCGKSAASSGCSACKKAEGCGCGEGCGCDSCEGEGCETTKKRAPKWAGLRHVGAFGFHTSEVKEAPTFLK